MHRRLRASLAALAFLPLFASTQVLAAGPPAKLTLTPDKAEMPAGATAPFTAKLLDADGMETTVEANSMVGFAVDISSVASVAIDPMNPLVGQVTAKRPGMTAVRAFYVRNGMQTTIFAASDLTVVAGPDGGTPSEHDAAAGGTGGAGGCAGTMCGGSCVDLTKDPLNCGQCAHACTTGQTCANGACQGGGNGGSGGSGGAGGTGGAAGCAGTMCGGTCADLARDVANCGVCGRVCASGQLCRAGVCDKDCGPFLRQCNNQCISQIDRGNCGTCGHACGENEVCKDGTTCAACAAGSTRCGDLCADLQNDRDNCSACGMRCPGSNDACVAGKCVEDSAHQHHTSCSLAGGPEGAGTAIPWLALLAGAATLVIARRRR